MGSDSGALSGEAVNALGAAAEKSPSAGLETWKSWLIAFRSSDSR